MQEAFDRFTRALAVATDPRAPFAALHELVQDTVGVRLFTVTTVEQDGRLARRSYSSDPQGYPVSGTKTVTPNRWTQIVLDRGETFVANRLDEMAEVFPDHALIGSLGLGSVVNMPVVLCGQIGATLNLLHVEGYYTADRVDTLSHHLKLPTMAAQMLHDRLRGSGSCKT